jgi:hypothetical protein
MRRPVTVAVAVLAIVLAAGLALRRMPADIFPKLGDPAIYVAQPYGGMDPAQMEGFLTYYYEYHFLYITGIEHVESKNIQGVALMKLVFHEDTDMNQAMAEVVAYVNRSRRRASIHYKIRCGQRPGRTTGVLESQSLTRGDARFRSQPRSPVIRNVAGRFGTSTVRRESADHCRSPRS